MIVVHHLGRSQSDRVVRLMEELGLPYARLGQSQYLAGPQFTCADIMVTFNLAELSLFGCRAIDDLPNARAYVKRIEARPAYAKAMQIAGPNAASRA